MSNEELLDQILDLQVQITTKIDHYASGNTNTIDLDLLVDKMEETIEQGLFWIEQQNPKRFIYDLNQLLIWIDQVTNNSRHETP
jgi:hypothetical protein